MITAGAKPAIDVPVKELSKRPCVVFDFDGTLGNTKDAIIRVVSDVLRDFGLSDKELEHVGDVVGPPFPYAFTKVFGLSEQDAAEVTRRFRATYNHLGPEGWPVIEGVPRMLGELRAHGKTLTCASSKLDSLLQRCLRDEGIDRFFACARGKKGDEETTKVQAIRTVVAEAGFTLDDAVMVGDRYNDVDAGTSAGIPTVGVLFGHTAEASELHEAGAAAVVDTVEDLERLLIGPAGEDA